MWMPTSISLSLLCEMAPLANWPSMPPLGGWSVWLTGVIISVMEVSSGKASCLPRCWESLQEGSEKVGGCFLSNPPLVSSNGVWVCVRVCVCVFVCVPKIAAQGHQLSYCKLSSAVSLLCPFTLLWGTIRAEKCHFSSQFPLSLLPHFFSRLLFPLVFAPRLPMQPWRCH